MRNIKDLYISLGEESYDYYSTQINLPNSGADAFARQFIDLIDLYQDEADQGIESTPHITVFYGIEDFVVDVLRKELKGFGSIAFEFGATEIFEHNDTPYDVVVVEVYSQDLYRLHDSIGQSVATTETFDYHPHMTLAYVKKGMGEKYNQVDTPLTGKQFMVSSIVFCDKHTKKQYLINLL